MVAVFASRQAGLPGRAGGAAAVVIAVLRVCALAGLSRRAGRWLGPRRSRLGLAGEGQECLLQGGPAQRQPADVQAGGGQPGRHLGKDSRPVGDRQDDPARWLVDGRFARAKRRQRRCQLPRVLAGRGLQFQPVAPGPGL